MQVIWLYCLSAQQQTCTFTCQKLNPIYSEIRGEMNEFFPSIQIQEREAKKLLKQSFSWKIYAICLSSSKG